MTCTTAPVMKCRYGKPTCGCHTKDFSLLQKKGHCLSLDGGGRKKAAFLDIRQQLFVEFPFLAHIRELLPSKIRVSINMQQGFKVEEEQKAKYVTLRGAGMSVPFTYILCCFLSAWTSSCDPLQLEHILTSIDKPLTISEGCDTPFL